LEKKTKFDPNFYGQCGQQEEEQEMKMKCGMCGNNELVFYGCVCGADNQPLFGKAAKTYICKKCRHVEWFADESTIEQAAAEEQKNAEHCKKMEEYESERAKLEKEIEQLRKIVADENQTVKRVREAELELVEAETKLATLREPRKDLW